MIGTVSALDTQPMVALPSFPVRLRFEDVAHQADHGQGVDLGRHRVIP